MNDKAQEVAMAQQEEEVYNPNDQSWGAWKKYLIGGTKYMAQEAWKIAVDAKNEGYNIYSETTTNIGGITYDVYMADKWAVTEKKRLQDEEDNKKGEIFSVESFHRLDKEANPALLKEETDSSKIAMVSLDAKSTELPTL